MSNHKWSKCGRKNRYDSWDNAERYARRIKEERGISTCAYYCEYCHGYHLTSMVDELYPKKNMTKQ